MSLTDLTQAERHLPDDPPETDHTPDPPPDWQHLDPHLPYLPDLPEPEPAPMTSRLERHYEHLLALAA